MAYSLLFATALVLSALTAAHAQNYGKYVGTVQSEWVGDRKMRLLSPFMYVDPKGIEWVAPAGWVIDGASVPQAAWSFIGGPCEGKYRDASVIHDVACDQKAKPWEQVHETFFSAMLASGVEMWRAKVMYGAVYHFGPRWPRQVTTTVPYPDEQRERKEVIRQQSAAAPGRTAKIVRHRLAPCPIPGGACGPPSEVDLDIDIRPPAENLRPEDFEKLKDKIQASAIAGEAGSGLSLEAIRSYQPNP